MPLLKIKDFSAANAPNCEGWVRTMQHYWQSGLRAEYPDAVVVRMEQ